MKFAGKVLILLAGIFVGILISSIIYGEIKSSKEDLTSESAQAYEEILNDYEEQLAEAAPKLIKEIEQEREAHSDNYEELAILTHEKITELAIINNDGMLEMAEVMREQNDSEANYKEYALELTEVYMGHAEELADAGRVSYKR